MASRPSADPTGGYEGIEAVIDKDLTAALLAEHIEADFLVIATDVENVVADWGTPDALPIAEVDATALRVIATEQQFAAGSMGPKVEAVTRFVGAAPAAPAPSPRSTCSPTPSPAPPAPASSPPPEPQRKAVPVPC